MCNVDDRGVVAGVDEQRLRLWSNRDVKIGTKNFHLY
jgi:hypothetical protein